MTHLPTRPLLYLQLLCLLGFGLSSCDEKTGTPQEDCPTCELDQEKDSPMDIAEQSCIEGSLQSCFSEQSRFIGVGECVEGVQHCAQGKWTSCEDEVLPTNEICDGLDNNCDGEIDESLSGCSTSPQIIIQVGEELPSQIPFAFESSLLRPTLVRYTSSQPQTPSPFSVQAHWFWRPVIAQADAL